MQQELSDAVSRLAFMKTISIPNPRQKPFVAESLESQLLHGIAEIKGEERNNAISQSPIQEYYLFDSPRNRLCDQFLHCTRHEVEDQGLGRTEIED